MTSHMTLSAVPSQVRRTSHAWDACTLSYLIYLSHTPVLHSLRVEQILLQLLLLLLFLLHTALLIRSLKKYQLIIFQEG